MGPEEYNASIDWDALRYAAQAVFDGEADIAALASYLDEATFRLGGLLVDMEPHQRPEDRDFLQGLWVLLGLIRRAASADGESLMKLSIGKRGRGALPSSEDRWARWNAALRVEHWERTLRKQGYNAVRDSAVKEVENETGLSDSTIRRGLREVRASRAKMRGNR